MAVFQIIIDGKSVQLHCRHCGGSNMFQHNPTLLTCNKCGNTFETPSEATVVIEKVVPLHG